MKIKEEQNHMNYIYRNKYYASHVSEVMTIYEENKLWEDTGKLEQ